MKVMEKSKISGFISIWDDERIKGAFKNGNGTKEDFIEFMKNNSKYAEFKIIEE